MVKPKTQIKAAVKGKSKTEISSEAIASRPTEKAAIERQESNDICEAIERIGTSGTARSAGKNRGGNVGKQDQDGWEIK